jgi:hypothetical protein
MQRQSGDASESTSLFDQTYVLYRGEWRREPEAALAAQLNPIECLIGRNWTVTACLYCYKLLILLVRPEGFEPPTLWLEVIRPIIY